MAKPNKRLIELCEDLLTRARSGEMEGIAVVEIREGEKIFAEMRNMEPDEAMKASAFLGHLMVRTFLAPKDETNALREVDMLRKKLERVENEQCGSCRAQDMFGLKEFTSQTNGT